MNPNLSDNDKLALITYLLEAVEDISLAKAKIETEGHYQEHIYKLYQARADFRECLGILLGVNPE